MKKLKIFGLTILLFVGFIIPSCDKQELDACGDPLHNQFFNIEGIDLIPYKTFYSRTEVLSLDSISFNELDNIYIDYLVTYHSSLQNKTNWSFSIINTANACWPKVGTHGSKNEAIESFSITTLNDFDNKHLANENINDLFNYDGYKNSWTRDGIPLTQYLEEQTGNILTEDLILILKKAPELNQEFKVKVKMELSTGEVYEIESNPIFITS